MNKKDDICQGRIINKEKVKKVKKQMISERTFLDMAETFKATADKTRLKILYALSMLMMKNNIKHGYEPVLPPYLVTDKVS